MFVLPTEYIFLTTFYSLYFNHQLQLRWCEKMNQIQPDSDTSLLKVKIWKGMFFCNIFQDLLVSSSGTNDLQLQLQILTDSWWPLWAAYMNTLSEFKLIIIQKLKRFCHLFYLFLSWGMLFLLPKPIPTSIKNKMNQRKRLLKSNRINTTREKLSRIKDLNSEIKIYFYEKKKSTVRRNIYPGNTAFLSKALNGKIDLNWLNSSYNTYKKHCKDRFLNWIFHHFIMFQLQSKND